MTGFLRGWIAALALWAGLPAAAMAQVWFYDHNGSVMRLEQAGSSFTITYETPRASLRDLGVGPGTLLFSGSYEGPDYVGGMAWIFSRRCGDIDYYVYGTLRPGGNFTLTGAAPVRDGTCRIVDNSMDDPNGRLVFTALSQPATPQRPLPLAAGACIAEPGGTMLRTGPGANYGALALLPQGLCGGAIRVETGAGWAGVEFQGWLGWVPGAALN